MKAIDKYKADRDCFIKCFFIYALVTFLTLAGLFVYVIYASNSQNVDISQNITGNQNNQEVNNGSTSKS
jgi:hypothetical protein